MHALNERKRQAYLITALVISLAWLLDGWVHLAGPGSPPPVVALGYIAFAGGLTALLFAALLWRHTMAYRLVEGVGIPLFAGFLLVRLAVVLYGADLPGRLGVATLWFAPLYTLIYAAYTSRRALQFAGLMYGATLALGLPLLLAPLLGGATASPAPELLQFYTATATVLLLLGVHAHLKDQSIRAQALAQSVADEAQTDFLVGLPNRRQLQQLLVSEREATRRDQRYASLILIDVDHFKPINDTFGHQVGDRVLVEVARRIRRCLRQTDICGRWGGEEFLVIIPDGDLATGAQLAERARQAIADEPFADVGTVTASFGVADLVEPLTLEIALGQADEAMYRAKRNGRNRVEVW